MISLFRVRTRFFPLLASLLCLLQAACSPTTLSEYQLEAEGVAKALIDDLEKVQTERDLVEKAPRLKKRYHQLVDLMIAAKKHERQHPEEEREGSLGREVSEALRCELFRVYMLEGCKEKLEEIERESLHKLDQFDRVANP